MSDVNAIIQVVSTLGFPIACCIWLFYRDNIKDKEHKEETDALTKALENNTIALTKLTERMVNNDRN